MPLLETVRRLILRSGGEIHEYREKKRVTVIVWLVRPRYTHAAVHVATKGKSIIFFAAEHESVVPAEFDALAQGMAK